MRLAADMSAAKAEARGEPTRAAARAAETRRDTEPLRRPSEVAFGARARVSDLMAAVGPRIGVEAAATRVSVVPSTAGRNWGRASAGSVRFGVTGHARADGALVVHELAHVAQHANRSRGVLPDVTRAESEAAGLALAYRTGRSLWPPRAALPDGHVAADDDANGIVPDEEVPAPAQVAPVPSASTGNELVLDTSFPRAVEEHRKDRETLKAVVEGGQGDRHLDPMSRNSCEFVATKKVKAYALTKTADSLTRAVGHGDSNAYFSYPAGSVYEPQVNYDPRNLSDPNVCFLERGVEGQNLDQGIALTAVAGRTRTDVLGILRHEIQHVVDDHKQSGSADPLKGYKSEFRAYWLGTRDLSYQDADRANISGVDDAWTWDSPRQLAIFKYVYNRYGYVKTAWDAENSQDGDHSPFQKGVVNFALPESPNPRNSPRVFDFDRALRALPPPTSRQVDRFDTELAVTTAHAALRPDDKAAVKASTDLQDLILTRGTADLRQHLADVIASPAAAAATPPAPDSPHP